MIKTVVILSVYFAYGHSKTVSITEFDSMAKCQAVAAHMIKTSPVTGLFDEIKIFDPERTKCEKIEYTE